MFRCGLWFWCLCVFFKKKIQKNVECIDLHDNAHYLSKYDIKFIKKILCQIKKKIFSYYTKFFN